MANFKMDGKNDIPEKRFQKLISDLRAENGNDSLDSLILKLETYRDGRAVPEVKPYALYLDVIESIKEKVDQPKLYDYLMREAEVIYHDVFLFGEDTPDYARQEAIFRVMAFGDGLAAQGFYDRAFFASFRDKDLYVALAKMIASKRNSQGIFVKIKKHGLEVREYLADEMAYFTHLVRIVEKLAVTSQEGMEEILDKDLLKLQRCSGFYDVDPVKLAQVEKNVTEAATTIESGRDVLQLLERKRQNVEKISDELDSRAKLIRQETARFLETKAEKARNEIEETIKEYEEGQKKAAFLEKDLFLKQMFSEAESEITKYKAQAKAITATAAAEVQGISRDADLVVKRIQNATSDNEKVKEIIDTTRRDEELMKLIEKLSALKESGEGFWEMQPEAFGVEPGMPPRPERDGMDAPLPPHGPGPHHGPGRRPVRAIPAVSPLLDRSVPFKDRFAILMKEKAKRMEAGELFHEKFDDVLTAVMESVNPYLIGPSGCGKTYMVKQIGELLRLDCTDIGYINEEYDVLGYVTAMGEYSESNFYRLYKYGGIAFCDELDNGNGKATVKLNSFLTNQEDACYHFPGGERVERHPNFRVIAAGNTDGNGADVNYNTREKLEESVQQRMIPIYVDYDNRVEQEILIQYPDWFAFACAYREATKQWSEVCGIPAQGIFTTRDAYRIKQYLDNNSFTAEKIMIYEFIQTKEPEYLGFLADEIGKRLDPGTKAHELFKIFAKAAENRRVRGN